MKNKKETKEQQEVIIKVKKGSPDEVKMQQKGVTYQVYEKEMKEDQDDNPLNPYGAGQTTQQPHQVGPDTNDGFGEDPGKTPGMYQDGMDESESLDEKKEKYNPWAVCTSSLGLEGKERDTYTPNEKKKFERCVMDVKKSMKEGKNPVQVMLETSIERMVQKHISPRITKGDLLQTLSEGGIIRKPVKNNLFQPNAKLDKPIGKLYTLTKKEAMEQAPTTAPPKVKPGTTEKPGKSDPFKNPKHQPKPKAGKNMVDDNPKAPVTKIPDYLTFDQLGITFENKK
jgi:hypothetical protein